MNTMYFYDEIQANPYRGTGNAGQKELELAKAIIGGMEEHFEPKGFRDEYRDRLLEAINAKADGKQIVSPGAKSKQSISDLMEALQKSLDEQVQRKKTASKAKAELKAKRGGSLGKRSSRPTA